MLSEAVCFEVGTLIAQWLFWQMNTTGALNTPAKFIATWKSPSEVAPSPMYAATPVRSPRILAAMAAPTACGELRADAARPADLVHPARRHVAGHLPPLGLVA